MTILDQFHEVQQLLAIQDLDSEVLDDEEVHLGHAVEELCGLGLNAGHLHGLQEFAHVEVPDTVARETALVSERGGEIALSDAGGAGDEDGGALPNVFAGSELHDAALVAALGRIEDDLFDACVITKAGVLDQPGRLVRGALVVFGLDEHHDAVLEGDFLMLPGLLETLPALGHA